MTLLKKSLPLLILLLVCSITLGYADIKADEIDENALLFAILKAENGRKDFEFGIEDNRARGFKKQREWCLYEIRQNKKRWDGKGDFIRYLAGDYCPINRVVWYKNVSHWYRRLK